MTTAYTEVIEHGVSFKDFALRCSRGFFYKLRDASFDIEIPDRFEADISYYTEQLAIAGRELEELMSMSIDEASKRAKQEYEKSIERIEKSNRERMALKLQYTNMLVSINAWEPPTEDHVNLKKFMLEQVESSIDYDCDELPIEYNGPQCGASWIMERIAYRKRDIEYYKTRIDEEVMAAQKMTQWFKDLKESLDNTTGGN